MKNEELNLLSAYLDKQIDHLTSRTPYSKEDDLLCLGGRLAYQQIRAEVQKIAEQKENYYK
ncbi:hypothetical protein [Marinococcus luteus]|uniref:hypothetical protein n=1 Tax=Marinococcus luteus TaxID=1122204 RepID=UPI002ACC8880|nr:hypothetical protein [Marinococcus luteus]MDZ5782469.1 hypothetical protein [Marinococcus luteus]